MRIAIMLLAFIILALVLSGCGAALGTAHVYTKPDGTMLLCPEELDPPPTTWTYNGTASVAEDTILEQCELE